MGGILSSQNWHLTNYFAVNIYARKNFSTSLKELDCWIQVANDRPIPLQSQLSDHLMETVSLLRCPLSTP